MRVRVRVRVRVGVRGRVGAPPRGVRRHGGDIGRYGEIWGDMGGILWGDMGRYGEIWVGYYGEI